MNIADLLPAPFVSPMYVTVPFTDEDSMGYHFPVPSHEWQALDTPCETCGGEGVTEPNRHDPPDHGPCPDCHGTGRTLHTVDQQRATVRLVPVVKGACPDKTNAPHRRAHIHVLSNGMTGMCQDNWHSKNLVTVDGDPPRPGDWVAIVGAAT